MPTPAGRVGREPSFLIEVRPPARAPLDRHSGSALPVAEYRRTGVKGAYGCPVKRISAEAYQALREALAAIVWNKRPFESYVRTALRDSPELLAILPFDEPKRVVADILVDRLAGDERRYQDVALNLMLEIASMTSFPNIELIKDEQDRARS